MDRVEQYKKVTDEMVELYAEKNKNYGDSFHKSMDEDGLLVSKIRLGDKFNRFKNLITRESFGTKDESLEDTLLDLASYAIMTVLWLRDFREGTISTSSNEPEYNTLLLTNCGNTKNNINYNSL